MVDKFLLDILVCPETKEKVQLADSALIASLNQRITSGEVKNHKGTKISDPITSGLLRIDGKALYPIIDDIPVMLIDERIDL